MRPADPNKREEDLERRAHLLVPLTLANTNELQFGVLVRLVELRQQLDNPPRSEELKERAQLLAELAPDPASGAPFSGPRSKREGMRHYLPWRNRLEHYLRRAVANAEEINGKSISATTLEDEKRAITEILEGIRRLNSLVQSDASKKAVGQAMAEVNLRLLDRRVEAHRLKIVDMRIDLKRDRLVSISMPHARDLGTANTECLKQLLETYPVSSVARCKLESCSRLFLPGAEGRRRTKAVLFCDDSCRRAWANARYK